MKLSKRLKAIADLVSKNDKIADIGCDHAYLSIYLAINNLCQKIIATEVVEGPYNIALNNIKKYNLEKQIKLYLTDGLINVRENLNTLIIAGMGATTIINIIKDYKYLKKVKKIIIQSNNDWEMIRRYFNSIGFYISKEVYVNENDKDYIIILAYSTNEVNTEEELMIGVYNSLNKKLYKNQLLKFEGVLKKIPNKCEKNYNLYKKKVSILKRYIN